MACEASQHTSITTYHTNITQMSNKRSQSASPTKEGRGVAVDTPNRKGGGGGISKSLVAVLILGAYLAAALYPALHTPATGPIAPTSRARLTQRSEEAGWKPHDVQGVDSSDCNIPRVDMDSITRTEFSERYLDKAPVILVGTPNGGNAFAQATRREYLLERYGNHTITLSSANRNSYDKKEVPLRTYLDRTMMMSPQTLAADGASTWYHFGDNKHDQWEGVFQHYERPTEFTFGKYSSLSFGLGPAGSGVPFHTHGHVFNEVIYGKKRWWLQAPREPIADDDGPRFDPDASSLQWLERVRPTYTPSEVEALHECVCVPGETLYIPSFWHHSTLNIGETVFMAVFV